MWYVIQTVGGQEQTVRALIERRSSGDASRLVEQCFIPMRERTVKRGGEWQLVQEKLFPGYVFVVTEDAQKLLQNLKSLPRFTRLLGTGVNEFVPLRPEEIAFLQKFEDSGHIARLSKVEVVEGGRIRILSGALLNCEGMITRCTCISALRRSGRSSWAARWISTWALSCWENRRKARGYSAS